MALKCPCSLINPNSHLQVLQTVFEALHGLAQLFHGLGGVTRQIAHCVFTIILPARAAPRLGVRFAAREFGVELYDGALLTDDSFLLLQDGLSKLNDSIPQLFLLRACALDPVGRFHRATEVGARWHGGAHEAVSLPAARASRFPAPRRV